MKVYAHDYYYSNIYFWLISVNIIFNLLPFIFIVLLVFIVGRKGVCFAVGVAGFFVRSIVIFVLLAIFIFVIFIVFIVVSIYQIIFVCLIIFVYLITFLFISSTFPSKFISIAIFIFWPFIFY